MTENRLIWLKVAVNGSYLLFFLCIFDDFRDLLLGGCNNPKYFIVPDILTGGYILRSFAKQIRVVALNLPPQPSI